MLTAIIVDQCRDRDDFLDEVMAWRRDSSAVKIRGWLREFQGDICNKRIDHVGRHFDRLDSFARSIGAKSSTKAKLVTCLTDPSLIEGSTASVLTANPVPAAAMAAHSVGGETCSCRS